MFGHISNILLAGTTTRGRAAGVECLRVQSLAFDETGSPLIETVEGSEHILPADTVIFTVGQRPEIPEAFGLETVPGSTIQVDAETLATNKEAVFAAGDAVTGTVSVIASIAAGWKAAASVDRDLGGDGEIDVVPAGVAAPYTWLGCRENFSFLHDASCGKCVFCREGTTQIYEILTDITEGCGKPDDLELLEELAAGMRTGSLCNLGKTAILPLLTTLKYFRDEYETHIRRKRCPALVCKKFITYHILPGQCRGCGLCLEHCPAGAIRGGAQMVHVIDGDECTKCGICLDLCLSEYNAVVKAGGVKPRTPDEPIPVTVPNNYRNHNC